MADLISLEIITPEKAIFADMVETINIPTLSGSIGILHNHAPLLTVVDIGVLRYTKDGKEHCIAVNKGFMEFKENKAEIMVINAERAEDIDKARALAAMKRAQKRISEKAADLDYLRAEAALRRAIARIKAAG